MTKTLTRTVLASLAVALVAGTLVAAQTAITAPKNKYKVSDDVQLGREAAQQARKEMPIMQDAQVSSYVSELGQKLVQVIPAELQHAEFKYTFETVNVRDINAFALPGGPMFVNRGMIEAAKVEGEVVGVMAHELSHVLLRHGTANMTKASNPWLQLGQIAGVVGGAVVGGAAGSGIIQATQFGFGSVLLKNSRDYEKQADLLGAQLMARAGYDARDMASMFKTIEKSGSNGPEFLSDHPNPGNRASYIAKEAEALHVDNPIHASGDFDRVIGHLRDLPKAPTTEEAMKNAKRNGGGSTKGGNTPTGRVAAPSTKYATFNEGDIFQISVPENWDELSENSSVTFAPVNGYGSYNGQSIFTHGVQLGVLRSENHPLQEATDELINELRRANPKMGEPSAFRNRTFGGRPGLQTTIDNVSDATNQRETLLLATAIMPNGDFIYAVFVAPANEFSSYQSVFQRVANSVKFLQ